jgi:hypothetical protein
MPGTVCLLALFKDLAAKLTTPLPRGINVSTVGMCLADSGLTEDSQAPSAKGLVTHATMLLELAMLAGYAQV